MAVTWTPGPDGQTAAHNGCSLRVSGPLSNGRYACFVHRPGDANQSRGEERTLEQAKATAVAVASRH